MLPVPAFNAMPSGNGGKFKLLVTEKVYGGNPPLAAIVQPKYAETCVPPGQDVVAIARFPPLPAAVTVTFTVDVVEPEELEAVRV